VLLSSVPSSLVIFPVSVLSVSEVLASSHTFPVIVLIGIIGFVAESVPSPSPTFSGSFGEFGEVILISVL